MLDVTTIELARAFKALGSKATLDEVEAYVIKERESLKPKTKKKKK